MNEVTWSVGGEPPSKKLPYVSTWKVFSKLDEQEKARIFNDMRAQLITLGRLEDKKGESE